MTFNRSATTRRRSLIRSDSYTTLMDATCLRFVVAEMRGKTTKVNQQPRSLREARIRASSDRLPALRVMDEPIGRHDNGHVSDDDETAYWLSVPENPESLAQSENDIAAGSTCGGADVRAYAADMHGAPPDEKAAGTDDPAAEVGAVAEAMAGADQETIDGWRAETDLWEAAELGPADADYVSGNTVSGKDLRPRHGLSCSSPGEGDDHHGVPPPFS